MRKWRTTMKTTIRISSLTFFHLQSGNHRRQLTVAATSVATPHHMEFLRLRDCFLNLSACWSSTSVRSTSKSIFSPRSSTLSARAIQQCEQITVRKQSSKPMFLIMTSLTCPSSSVTLAILSVLAWLYLSCAH